MKPTRRDLLALSGGAIAGVMFTPVPWKVLDDASIWTQNWKWIPQPAHVPVEAKHASCALCPNACGIAVRLAAGWPVGLSGEPGHPVSRGALCPLAFGAHQLNWHPRRLRQVLHHGRPASWEQALAAFRQASAAGSVAIVDGRGGRAASTIYQKFAGQRGTYYVTRAPEEHALAPYEGWSGAPAASLGYDLENARTIVSFGAPLLDGWGTPGRFTRLWSERAAGSEDPDLRLIQLEAALSRTGSLAWMRVAHRPGSGAMLAAGLARTLLDERLVAAKGPAPAVTLAQAAEETGLRIEAIRNLARVMVSRTPAIAISSGFEPGVAALNLLLGGGIVQRGGLKKPPTALESWSGSPRAVLIDSMVPWEVEPQTDGEVFRFAAWDGGGSKADWLLPAPGFLEDLTDIPAAPASALETYALAPALVSPPEAVSSAAAFLAKIDPTAGTVEDAIRARSEDLFKARKGSLRRPGQSEPVALAGIESAAKFQSEMLEGVVWVDDSSPRRPLHCELRQWPAANQALPAADWAAAWRPPVLPPLADKLFRESDLREIPARSRI
jgi:hypothetical protein